MWKVATVLLTLCLAFLIGAYVYFEKSDHEVLVSVINDNARRITAIEHCLLQDLSADECGFPGR